VPEVRKQAAHASTLRVQRGEIGWRNFVFGFDIFGRGLRLHAAHLRV